MFEGVKREYGKGEIDRAGHFLKEWWISENFEDYKEGEGLRKWNEAFRVVENWRTCHGLPLNVIQAGLRVRVRRVERRAIVAQRLKRFSSMVDKLAREDDMQPPRCKTWAVAVQSFPVSRLSPLSSKCTASRALKRVRSNATTTLPLST